jgi:DNA-3-methyladenine glycosylase
MYGEPGRAYLYLVYGMHTCLNVVTEPSGRPAAVLIRAVEIVEGVELAREHRLARETANRRHRLDPEASARIARRLGDLPHERLAAGPGLVGAALGLRTEMTGLDLCDPASRLRIEPDPPAHGAGGQARGAETTWPIRVTRRIGIAYAGPPWTERPWRLVLAGHPSTSGPVALR